MNILNSLNRFIGKIIELEKIVLINMHGLEAFRIALHLRECVDMLNYKYLHIVL